VQLAFPSLVASPFGDSVALLATLRAHDVALRRILASIRNHHWRDALRADLIRQIRAAHPGVPIVAFSQYAETVRALFSELRAEPGVASLTAAGARVAGGTITRREALARFAPVASGAKTPRYIDRIDLLLTTDLLSEGVNLQDAGVVIHLDLPWTAARLEQRLGRVRRLGSIHSRVHAFGIRPSTAAEALISLEKTIRKKLREAEQSVGGSRPLLPDAHPSQRVPGDFGDPITAIERIRAILEGWCGDASHEIDTSERLASHRLWIAATASKRNGFLALCTDGPDITLLASEGKSITDDPNEILAVLLDAGGEDVLPPSSAIARAEECLRSWFRMTGTVGPTERRAASVAHARRRALRRISVIVEHARPHTRQSLLNLAERARTAVLGRLGAAAESELLAQASSHMPDEDWLRAMSQGGAPGDDGDVGSMHFPRAHSRHILALLLLVDSKPTR
jgi:hypothetical protein